MDERLIKRWRALRRIERTQRQIADLAQMRASEAAREREEADARLAGVARLLETMAPGGVHAAQWLQLHRNAAQRRAQSQSTANAANDTLAKEKQAMRRTQRLLQRLDARVASQREAALLTEATERSAWRKPGETAMSHDAGSDTQEY